MRPKHEIPNKTDYMKAYSFNFIQTERTNTELAHEKNVGKIDGAFYRHFSWQIMGKRKERQLSQTESNVARAKNEVLSKASRASNSQEQSRQESEGDRIVIQSRTDLSGNSPKRYVSTCYVKPKTIPAWYTESLLIHIGSTKRKYSEKIWFKQKLQPYYWSENMTTEVNFPPAQIHVSQVAIAVPELKNHYISLESQQTAAGAS